MLLIVLYFVDDTCFPQHGRIRRRHQLRLQVNHETCIPKVMPLIFRVRCGTLNSDQSEKYECIMEFPWKRSHIKGHEIKVMLSAFKIMQHPFWNLYNSENR